MLHMLKVTAAQYWFESHILIVSKETVLYIGGQVCNYHEGLGNSLFVIAFKNGEIV